MAATRKKTTKKIFVLDTNVILHDYECIHKFEENDIYIPVTVLEELDKFKKGSEQINFNARAFVRFLDDASDSDFFHKGASLGEGRGRLYVYLSGQEHPAVKAAFTDRIADHRILSVALNIAEEHKPTPTILVTKDVNLRMKAKALGMPVEDYFNDKVTDHNIFEKAHEEFTGISGDLIDRIYADKGGIPAEELDFHSKLVPNQCFILKSDRNSIMVRFDPCRRTINQVPKRTCAGITSRNAEQAFAFEVLCDEEISLVAITGKAGTGKTLLALASAIEQCEQYNSIMLARPIVALANKDLGFLPGDEKQKITPYMQPLFDNLSFIKSQLKPNGNEIKRLEQMEQDGTFVIEALAYIRGRSLSNSLIIVDEAQNLTPHEVKTIVTRAGEGTKIILTGDIEQIDSPYLDAESNGLAYLVDKMREQDLFAHVNLVKGERSKLSELASNLL